MKKVPDKVFSRIPGFRDGQATFTRKMTPGDLFTFYERSGLETDHVYEGGKGSGNLHKRQSRMSRLVYGGPGWKCHSDDHGRNARTTK